MRCALIVPYFGEFPNFFQLFLNSCQPNRSFTWFIFTDNTNEYDYPENVSVVLMTFEELKSKIEKTLGETITLTRPYKLCDFRPAYGLIFKEYIQDYDYWGYCDIDLLFGNLDEHVLPLMRKKYDKIFSAGHLTLYRNKKKNYEIFKLPLNGKVLYRDVFKCEQNLGFDEDGGCKQNVHNIYLEHKFKVYDQDLSFNCSDKFYSFHRSVYNPVSKKWIIQKKQKAIYFWTNGSIKEYILKKKSFIENEYIYMHFQGKKSLKVLGSDYSSTTVLIQPQGFIRGVDLPNDVSSCKKLVAKFSLSDELKMYLFRMRLKLGKVKILLLSRRRIK